MKILEVSFPPTVGYSANKVYSYVTDLPEPEKATHAIICDPQGQMVLTKIVRVVEYQPKAFKMKHVVKLLYIEDVLAQQRKPAV